MFSYKLNFNQLNFNLKKFSFKQMEHSSKKDCHLSLYNQVRMELHFLRNPNKVGKVLDCCSSRNKLLGKELDYLSNQNNHMGLEHLRHHCSLKLEQGKEWGYLEGQNK